MYLYLRESASTTKGVNSVATKRFLASLVTIIRDVSFIFMSRGLNRDDTKVAAVEIAIAVIVAALCIPQLFYCTAIISMVPSP